MNPIKLALSRGFETLGLNRGLLAAQRRLLGCHLRAVNYHDIPARKADGFSAQLRFYAQHFQPVGLHELRALHQGHWPHRRPGLIISFDDGLKSQAEVAAPLLEEHGFVGWFMVPTAFVDTPAEAHAAFARSHHIHGDPPQAMSWQQVRELDRRGHVIGGHTKHHTRLKSSLSQAELEDEIMGCKQRLERELEHPVDVFAWVGGEEWSYSAKAAQAIQEAGFRYSFMTNHAVFRQGDNPQQIQRSNVEADYPPSLMRLHLSGFMDLLYTAKRRRVNRVTQLG